MDDRLRNATAEQLAHAIEANAVACCLSWADWPEMERHDEECLTWTMSDVAFPFFNNTFFPNMAERDVDPVVDRVLEIARARNVPMFWWVGPATVPRDFGSRLLAKGLEHGFEAPAMAADLHHMNETHAAPDGLTIQEATTPQMLADWCAVMAPVYEFPDFAAAKWFELLAYLGLGQDRAFRHYVGYLHERPVASASLYLGNGVGGVSAVATAPQVRRQGIATAITLETLREARRLGYQYGALFSSAMGLGIYKKIGFQEYGKGGCYVSSNA